VRAKALTVGERIKAAMAQLGLNDTHAAPRARANSFRSF
jgi:hypothetical protein